MSGSLRFADEDRVRELAAVGAGQAAVALGQLLGCEILASAPRAHPRPEPAEEGAAAVIFETQGSVRVLVALLLPGRAREALLRSLLGQLPAEPEAVRSALCETGNIVASRAISAVADHVQGRVTLSLPEWVARDGGRAFQQRVAERSGGPVRISELYEPAGLSRALLLFAADAPRRHI